MNKPIRIIQCSHPGSGSTVLVNILTAFFQPHEPVSWLGKPENIKNHLNNNIVLKTHYKNLDEWIDLFSKDYQLFFIISDRKDYDWNKYYDYPNVLFIDYSDILETETNTLLDISTNIYNKCESFLPKQFMIYNRKNISIQNSVNRITNMNKRYEEIKNESFDFVDKYYQLHGSHRNKNHDESIKTRIIKK